MVKVSDWWGFVTAAERDLGLLGNDGMIGRHYPDRNKGGWVVVTDETCPIYDEPVTYVRVRRRFKTMGEAIQKVSPTVRQRIKELARIYARLKKAWLAHERLKAQRKALFEKFTAGLVYVGLTSYLPNDARKVFERNDWDPEKYTGLNKLTVWEDSQGRRVVQLAWGNARNYWLHPDFVDAAFEQKWQARIDWACKRESKPRTLAVAEEGLLALVYARWHPDSNEGPYSIWIAKNKLDEVLSALRQCEIHTIKNYCCGFSQERVAELAKVYGLRHIPNSDKHGVFLRAEKEQ